MRLSKDVSVETDLAVRWLLARYCHLIDDRDFDAAAALFADDARFRVLEEELNGRDAIRKWFDTLPAPMFHQVTNVVVSNGSNTGTAHAVSDLTAGGKADSGWSIWLVGRYHDTFEGSGRQMRFTQRIVTAR